MMMEKALTQPLLKFFEQTEYEQTEEEEGDVDDEDDETEFETEGNGGQKYRGGVELNRDEIDGIAQQFSLSNLHKRDSKRRGEEQSIDKYGVWIQELNCRAAILQKQLKSKWALEELIGENLNHFHAHYNRAASGPTLLKDVADLLMPKWAPPHEMAALAWLGGWRPSAILDLLRSLARSSSALFLSSVGIDRSLAQLIHEIRIEEAILDEEMAEIQSTCILHLPFGPKSSRPKGLALACIQSEFRKIHRVVNKAQKLRLKALEMAVKNVLSQTDAAEFLIAFTGIQDAIHHFAVQQKLRKGPISVPVKALRNG